MTAATTTATATATTMATATAPPCPPELPAGAEMRLAVHGAGAVGLRLAGYGASAVEVTLWAPGGGRNMRRIAGARAASTGETAARAATRGSTDPAHAAAALAWADWIRAAHMADLERWARDHAEGRAPPQREMARAVRDWCGDPSVEVRSAAGRKVLVAARAARGGDGRRGPAAPPGGGGWRVTRSGGKAHWMIRACGGWEAACNAALRPSAGVPGADGGGGSGGAEPAKCPKCLHRLTPGWHRGRGRGGRTAHFVLDGRVICHGQAVPGRVLAGNRDGIRPCRKCVARLLRRIGALPATATEPAPAPAAKTAEVAGA